MKTTMKNYFLGLTASALLFSMITGCDGNKQQEARFARERDSLVNQLNVKDSAISNFIGSFNDIETNLATIKEKESIITLNSKSKGELTGEAKDRINEDIQTINKLMDENREKIAELNERLRKAGNKAGSLEKMVRNLNNQLAAKEKELADLRTQLATLNLTIETLRTTLDTITAESTGKTKVINEQTNKLNTAFYAVGTYKLLKEKKVLNKEGGFLGLGKEEVLTKDFNTEYFTQIDITKVSTIPVNDKKAKLLTTHPTDSYRFDTDDKKVITNLVITNPEKFWKASKYMVIVVD